MEPASPTGISPLSRVAWQELLSCCVSAPEFEPPIRRHARRYGIQLGAWRLMYQAGRRLTALRVRLANAAADGVMLLSHADVPDNIPVLLTFTGDRDAEYELVGQVVHCTSTVGGYKVGVRLRFSAGTG